MQHNAILEEEEEEEGVFWAGHNPQAQRLMRASRPTLHGSLQENDGMPGWIFDGNLTIFSVYGRKCAWEREWLRCEREIVYRERDCGGREIRERKFNVCKDVIHNKDSEPAGERERDWLRFEEDVMGSTLGDAGLAKLLVGQNLLAWFIRRDW